jgi:hypothetical protein
LGDPLFTFDVGAGFAKSSAPLRAQFDAHLAALQANGTYADMKRRWIETGATELPAIDAPRTVRIADLAEGTGLSAGARSGLYAALRARGGSSLPTEGARCKGLADAPPAPAEAADAAAAASPLPLALLPLPAPTGPAPLPSTPPPQAQTQLLLPSLRRPR